MNCTNETILFVEDDSLANEQPGISSSSSGPGVVDASLPAAQSETTDGIGLDQAQITSDGPSAEDTPDGVSHSQGLMGGTVRLDASTDQVVWIEVVVPVGICLPPVVFTPAVAPMAGAGAARGSRR